jgi:ketosteroid isomerase-like protein
VSTRVADTQQVVRDYYRAVNSGNWEAWLGLFADNAIVDEQLAGHLEGIDSLRPAVDGLRKGYSKFQMHPMHTVVSGDEASVIWHCEAANAKGVPIDAHGANWFEVKRGRITRMSTHHDSVPFRPFLEQEPS